jgi:hypothetical protein
MPGKLEKIYHQLRQLLQRLLRTVRFHRFQKSNQKVGKKIPHRFRDGGF